MPQIGPLSSVLRLMLAAATVFPACRSTGNEPVIRPNDPPATTAATPLAIVGVRVIPMTTNAILDNQTVLVRDGAITAIGSAATIDVPAGSTVIEGAGRYLMPALIDMHVHLSSSQDLEKYVSSGIGTVRNMWGHASIAGWQRDVATGTRVGPTIISASPGVDSPPAQWPVTLLVTDARQVRAIVNAQADAGWPYLKVYTRLTTEMFDSVMVAAKDVGIPALGHVPFNVDIHHALASGMESIEHFTGYDRAVSRAGRGGTSGWSDADPARYPQLVAETVAAGVWNCPTLAIYSELSKQHSAAERDAIIRNRRAFVRALSQAGAKLLVGTDAGIDVVAPGTSIHDELREFVAAGLTPFDALRGATTSAAEFLGRPELGRVVVGARADLLLLEANPLSNIENAKRIDGVVLGGAWRPN